MDHILSDLSTMTQPLGWPHTAWLSFIELDKAVIHVIRLASSVIVVSVCLPSDPLSQCLPSYLGIEAIEDRFRWRLM